MYSKCLSGRIKREEEFGDKKERYAEEVLGEKKKPTTVLELSEYLRWLIRRFSKTSS